MAKHATPPEDHPVGNTDPGKRGRGGDAPIGQKIPDRVKDKIKPSEEK